MKRIIIRSGNTSYEGWSATQENELNLLNINDYYKLFEQEESVDAFLAEHGIIGRSIRFDTRNNEGRLGMVSLIIDAYKK